MVVLLCGIVWKDMQGGGRAQVAQHLTRAIQSWQKYLTFRFFNPRRSMPAEEAVMVAVVHLLNGSDTAGGGTEPVLK